MEEWRIQRELVPIDGDKLALQEMCVLITTVGDLAKPLWADARHVDCGRGGHQSLIRADIARCLFAPDVLLTGLQRQHETAFALGIVCDSGEPAGHRAHERLPGGEQTDVRPAETLRDAERLSLGSDDIGSQFAW